MSAEENKNMQEDHNNTASTTENTTSPTSESDSESFISVQDMQKQSEANMKAAEQSVEESSEGEEEQDVSALQAELVAAKAKADENWDKYLRIQAEMENLGRRKDKQIEDAHKFSTKKMVESLLPVVDSLEMGLQAEGDLDNIREGMQLTLKQFESVMEKFDIQVIDPAGQKFNPELHQAMSMQPNPDFENNDVILVMQKGYTLSGRLVRPAMVMVCKN